MAALHGRSGIVHVFSKVQGNSKGMKVVEVRKIRVGELDVIGLYAKMIDVEACSGELVVSSYTREAQDLARQYGIELKVLDETC